MCLATMAGTTSGVRWSMPKRRYRPMNRHTMGHDRASPPPYNPPDAPKVTEHEVIAEADKLGLVVNRGTSPRFFTGRGMWWVRRKGSSGIDAWRTAGMTNYLCLEYLRNYYG